MIKKIFGVIFIIIAFIFLLGFLAQIPKVLSVFNSNNLGYSIGYLIGSLLFLGFSIFLFRIGSKWLKKKSKRISEIDNIGEN